VRKGHGKQIKAPGGMGKKEKGEGSDSASMKPTLPQEIDGKPRWGENLFMDRQPPRRVKREIDLSPKRDKTKLGGRSDWEEGAAGGMEREAAVGGLRNMTTWRR